MFSRKAWNGIDADILTYYILNHLRFNSSLWLVARRSHLHRLSSCHCYHAILKNNALSWKMLPTSACNLHTGSSPRSQRSCINSLSIWEGFESQSPCLRMLAHGGDTRSKRPSSWECPTDSDDADEVGVHRCSCDGARSFKILDIYPRYQQCKRCPLRHGRQTWRERDSIVSIGGLRRYARRSLARSKDWIKDFRCWHDRPGDCLRDIVDDRSDKLDAGRYPHFEGG